MAYDRQKMIRAIYDAGGNVTRAAELLGCAPLTIYRNMKKYATVQNAVDESRAMFEAGLLDIAESELRKAAEDGKAWAIRYVLDTKGKRRGYDARSRIDIDGNLTYHVRFDGEDLEDNADS